VRITRFVLEEILMKNLGSKIAVCRKTNLGWDPCHSLPPYLKVSFSGEYQHLKQCYC